MGDVHRVPEKENVRPLGGPNHDQIPHGAKKRNPKEFNRRRATNTFASKGKTKAKKVSKP